MVYLGGSFATRASGTAASLRLTLLSFPPALTVQAWSELEDFLLACDDLRDIMGVYRRHPKQRMWVAVEHLGSPRAAPSVAPVAQSTGAVRVRERVLGCVALQDMGNGAAELVRMVLVPEARGQRLGGRLLEQWRAHARQAGFVSMQLRTNFLLQRAVRFYSSQGMTLTSRQTRSLMRGDLLYFGTPL